MSVDLQKAQRESARWMILECLNAARPYGTGEGTILASLQAVPMQITALDLRREMDYLEERELIEIGGKGTPAWHGKLTRAGVDVAEYTVDCEPGIARPKKYW